MSGAQIAVLGHTRVEPPPRASAEAGPTRGLTMTAFMLLAVYGVLRWSTMLQGSSAGDLFGLLLLTLTIVWLGGHCGATRLWARVAAAGGMLAAALAMIPVSGFPLRWLLDLRVALLARSIGHGLSALPHVIVPYSGAQLPTGAVITLGAGMLLLSGALALSTTGPRVGQARLVAAAVPLIVLAIVPSVLSEPRLAGLHGVVLLLGLLALLGSERVSPRRVAGAVTFALLTAVLALILTPAVESSHAWVNVKKIGSTQLHAGTRFDWSQTYGHLNWPHQGNTVLTVQARFPSYWKAEDIDLFNGSDWVSTDVSTASQMVGVSRAAEARWSERLTVRLGAMSSNQFIAAGVADPPRSPAFTVAPGNGPGTWENGRPLGPGSTYSIDVYAPSPSRAQLISAPARYPMSQLASELQLVLPVARSAALFDPATPIQFSPFGSAQRVEAYGGLDAAQEARVVRTSYYGRAFRLATRLRAHAHTPYGYVQAVLRYLAHGYTYNQSPPTGSYPLLTFLFRSREGYCQQFAGAMALLLRMGGVPARVAAGFSTGAYDRRSHSYQVSDFDAHAWVEAWFAGYGWVAFDPTPSADPALNGISPLPTVQASSGTSRSRLTPSVDSRRAGAAAPTGPRHRDKTLARPTGGVSPMAILVIVLVLLALGLAGLVWRAPRTPEAYVDELERAFARTRRALPPAVTLAGLERRFADTPEAAEYVRSLGQARFAGRPVRPSHQQRRAVRRRLARGLGPLGPAWALVALPPLVRRLH